MRKRLLVVAVVQHEGQRKKRNHQESEIMKVLEKQKLRSAILKMKFQALRQILAWLLRVRYLCRVGFRSVEGCRQDLSCCKLL